MIFMAEALVMLMTWALSATATTNPNMGCETIHWGFLGSQLLTICDGPRRPAGVGTAYAWSGCQRITSRTPALGAHIFGSCWGGYYVNTTVVAKEQYVVFDYNVLHDEPGWLPEPLARN